MSRSRRGARPRPGGLREPGRLARADGLALHLALDGGPAQAEERPAGSRLRRHGRGGWRERHAVSTGRRGLRRAARRVRGIRRGRRGSSRRPQAGGPELRAGGRRRGGGADRAAGSARQGAAQGGRARRDQRRFRRRRHLRRPDRQVVRGLRDRRLQHRERRHSPLPRCGRGRRLHARGFHPRREALRPPLRHRGQPLVVGLPAGARARGEGRRGGRAEEEPLGRPPQSHGQGSVALDGREPAGRLVHREAEARGPRDAPRAPRDRQRDAGHRQELRVQLRP